MYSWRVYSVLCQERFYLLVAYIPPKRMYHLAGKLHNSAAGNVCGPRRTPVRV